VTTRIFNSIGSLMARPFYLATALPGVADVSRFAELSVINRHSGALDSGKEGRAP
jgi:hypothetical protein